MEFRRVVGKNESTRCRMVQRLAANIAFICETWERPGQPVIVPGYSWIANPRLHSNKTQMGGSEGVGFLVKTDVKDLYNVDIIDNSADGFVALLFQHRKTTAQCY